MYQTCYEQIRVSAYSGSLLGFLVQVVKCADIIDAERFHDDAMDDMNRLLICGRGPFEADAIHFAIDVSWRLKNPF